METLWRFKTARFTVTWSIEVEHGYEYDGEDPDGRIQAQLDAGDLVAFDSCVAVWLDGRLLSKDWLGGSVYKAGEEATFRTDGGYFRDMVATAIGEARKALANCPAMRH